MNRKLHNSVTALFATTGLLVLSLMAANPVRTTQEVEVVAVPVVQQVSLAHAEKAQPENLAAQARHAAAAAARIEARAAQLEASLKQSKDSNEALGVLVGFAAEAATLATLAAAMDGLEGNAPAIADNAMETEDAPPARKRAHGRQSVSMPFFSFAPRG
jgi:hypothetical protein